MDIIAIVLALWMITALLMQGNDDDDFHGGLREPHHITVITRRCTKR